MLNSIKGHLKVVKFLADLEIISIDLRTKKGETACDIAKRNGHQAVVDFLNDWRISPSRLPHETRQQSAIRRMKESARNGKSYEEMISRQGCLKISGIRVMAVVDFIVWHMKFNTCLH